MNIAIYSRKSKFTGKGESVENQVNMCKQYAYTHFENIDENNFHIYEDEGFSGSNIDRPEFKKFLHDAKTKNFDILIVYRLDRLSRNVADFSNVFKKLEANNISFISIKENFDTSSPMGKAMLHISSVFAQLERDTIAERIKDNFDELAKTGRWLGGQAPYGYVSKKIIFEKDNKSRSYNILENNEEELKVVKIIFEKYLHFSSLSMTFKYMNENGYKTKKGKRFNFQSIRDILKNPTYCIADEDIYEYYKNNNASIYGEKSNFNGAYGLSVYNRTKTKEASSQQVKNEISNYTVTTGFHQGIIKGSEFIKVQNIFDQNKDKAFSKQRTCPAILHTITYCGECGSKMPALNGRILKDGTQSFKYICLEKRITRKVNCQADNIDGYVLEKLVINKLQEVISDFHSDFHKGINDVNFNNNSEINFHSQNLKNLQEEYYAIDKKINNLVDVISSDDFDLTTTKVLSEKINTLDSQKNELSIKIFNIQTQIDRLQNHIIDINFIKSIYQKFLDFDILEKQEKINLIKLVIDKIIIYKDNIDIKLLYNLDGNNVNTTNKISDVDD